MRSPVREQPSTCATPAHDGRADLIIRHARVIDGSGGPSFDGDVAIVDERIVAVGDLANVKASRIIDAAGAALAPGFVDVHTHDDRALLADPAMAPKVSQGVTTVVTGNCGASLAPLASDRRPPPPLNLLSREAEGFFAGFADYLGALDRDPAAVNAVCLVGHTTLRVGAMANLSAPASAAERALMRERLEAALDAGAAGMSTGLYYAPAIAAPTEEVIELAGALAAAGAVHTTHMRDESDAVANSLEETFRIGREAAVPVVISHHKCAGLRNHGRSEETLGLIDAARAGQTVGLDVYPYTAASTVLEPRRLGEASRITVTWSEPRPDLAGRDLDVIAAEMECDREAAAERIAPAGAVYFMMDEGDVRRIMAYPHTMIGSDGLPHDSHPHPRLWGTFPRVLGRYARELGLFSLEEAVRRMTSLAAAHFGLTERGAIRPGAFADLVLFDPERVIDRATFEEPEQPAEGIELVLVNGRPVWRDGAPTGDRPGKTLRLKDLHPLGTGR